MFRLLKTRSDVGCAISFYMSNSLFKICQAHFSNILWAQLSLYLWFDDSQGRFMVFCRYFPKWSQFLGVLEVFRPFWSYTHSCKWWKKAPATATISDFVRLGLLSLKNKYLINFWMSFVQLCKGTDFDLVNRLSTIPLIAIWLKIWRKHT